MEERRFGFQEENLLSPAQALAVFFERVTIDEPHKEYADLATARGRILAARIDADRDYPDAPRSAMDGFALESRCVPGTLRIAGEVMMGSAAAAGEAGAALRIPTGGVVPPWADAVVAMEDVEIAGESIVVLQRIRPGENINLRGGDMRAGEAVLHQGRRIGGPQLGLLATLGIVRIPVYRRPLVGVLSSGDELVPPGEAVRPGQIRDSNRYAVAGTLEALGARTVHLPTVGDERGALRGALARALETCDAVVITGGSSVGERDRTPEAIAELGEPGVLVHGLRVKPGKPTVFAAIGRTPIIGLPGNPTSALMILEAAASPIFERLTGSTRAEGALSAVLATPVQSRRGWTWYVPVVLQHEGSTLVAHPLPLRSSTVSLAARADGYVELGEDCDELPAGATVDVHRFR